MNIVKGFIYGSLVLIGLYLLLANRKGTTDLIGTLGTQTGNLFKTLQARD